MLHIALYQPEIPPNTGNIMRLCANTGFSLHLIRPLGFALEDKKLKRAGLDYQSLAKIIVHDSYTKFQACFAEEKQKKRLFAFSARGHRLYCDPDYQVGDILLFGPETRGLPTDLLEQMPTSNYLRIPMQTGSRSLNLSNAVSIAAFEAWRQCNFITNNPL